jgi:recombination protein RecT
MVQGDFLLKHHRNKKEAEMSKAITTTNGSIRDKALAAVKKADKAGTMLGLKANDITDIIRTYRSAIAQAIPRHLTVDRVIQQATTLVSRSPAIAECSVESIIGATMQASILGFQPVAALGQCYFVPFYNKKSGKKEVQFIIGYKGYIDLARRSNEIKSIYGYPVFENDTFEFELGLEPKLKHIPAIGHRGNLTHAYAVAKFINGGEAFDVVTREDVMKRKNVSQAKGSEFSPWNTWEEEMWVKTAIKTLQKWLPLSVEQQQTIATDESVIKIQSFGVDGELNPDAVEIPDPEFEEVAEEVAEEPVDDGIKSAEAELSDHKAALEKASKKQQGKADDGIPPEYEEVPVEAYEKEELF